MTKDENNDAFPPSPPSPPTLPCMFNLSFLRHACEQQTVVVALLAVGALFAYILFLCGLMGTTFGKVYATIEYISLLCVTLFVALSYAEFRHLGAIHIDLASTSGTAAVAAAVLDGMATLGAGRSGAKDEQGVV